MTVLHDRHSTIMYADKWLFCMTDICHFCMPDFCTILSYCLFVPQLELWLTMKHQQGTKEWIRELNICSPHKLCICFIRSSILSSVLGTKSVLSSTWKITGKEYTYDTIQYALYIPVHLYIMSNAYNNGSLGNTCFTAIQMIIGSFSSRLKWKKKIIRLLGRFRQKWAPG